MIRTLIRCAAMIAVFGLGACEDSLVVQNPNSGETKRVLATPDDAEALLASYYKRWHGGLYGLGNPPGNFEGMANVMSLMNYSSLANNCQNSRAPFSGATNSNAPGNTCGGDQASVYFTMGEVDRVASNILTQMRDSGLTLGPTLPADLDNRNLRAKSYAEFLRGLSLGYLALFYDSAAVISPTMGEADCKPDPFSKVCVGTLRGYKEVHDSAMAAFERSIAYANTKGNGNDGFPLPADWIPSPTSFTATEFVRLVRSYRARIAANVARNPAERAAVNWDAVIADAQNGITADHLNTTSTTNGPGGGWRRIYDGGSTWHQMPPFIIGMGDTSGTYLAWLRTPLGERGAGNVGFFMVTPDLRFPQGTSRTAQQADFAITSCQAASTPCKRYFANRPNGSDQFSGLGWGFSNYDFNRFHSWVIRGDGTARNGNLVFYTKAELDMLQAEGLIRKGQYAAAAALINVTRVKNGLPPITAFDNTSPVPGGNACVPKFPQGNGPGATLTCGTMFEAMKWEKRIEEAYTHFAPWYLDMRGWGDLPEQTAIFWPVPYQDLQARGYAVGEIYGAGIGAGNAPNSSAGKSTYGW
jgi:hypothetical protein